MSTLEINTRKLFEIAGTIFDRAVCVDFDMIYSNIGEEFVSLKNDMYLKRIFGKKGVIGECTKEQYDKIPDLPTYNRYALLYAKAVSEFPIHYHFLRETIICVYGILEETRRNLLLKEGEKMEFEPLELHGIRVIEDSLLILVIHPKEIQL